MSLEQWRALGQDTSVRSELQEGVVIVSPSPTPRHQRAIMRLGVCLHAAMPAEYDALPEVDVLLDPAFPPTVRRPDLIVTRSATGPVAARNVVVVIEVLFPGTRRVDLVLKRSSTPRRGFRTTGSSTSKGRLAWRRSHWPTADMSATGSPARARPTCRSR
ncbi:Uma2 family endonuclease [Gordonia sp. MMO-8]|nr:Uma2 family endonuclease [Gordonia sp. PDNC005]